MTARTAKRKLQRATASKRRHSAPRFWRAQRVSGPDAFQLVPCPFLSERGLALLAMRDNRGALNYLFEIEQAHACMWSEWSEHECGNPTTLDRHAMHCLDWGARYLAQSIDETTGPLFGRGVHLAPWAPRFAGGRTFVAIDRNHRLIAHSDTRVDEREADVVALLSAALEIADPPASEESHASA